MNDPNTIQAHAWNAPAGTCGSCGWLVWVPKDATEHTCGGCGKTLPVVYLDGAESYDKHQAWTHSLFRA